MVTRARVALSTFFNFSLYSLCTVFVLFLSDSRFLSTCRTLVFISRIARSTRKLAVPYALAHTRTFLRSFHSPSLMKSRDENLLNSSARVKIVVGPNFPRLSLYDVFKKEILENRNLLKNFIPLSLSLSLWVS